MRYRVCSLFGRYAICLLDILPTAGSRGIPLPSPAGVPASWVTAFPPFHAGLVIHATDAHFNKETLTYEYPNGLHEPLLLPDHLQDEVVNGF